MQRTGTHKSNTQPRANLLMPRLTYLQGIFTEHHLLTKAFLHEKTTKVHNIERHSISTKNIPKCVSIELAYVALESAEDDGQNSCIHRLSISFVNAFPETKPVNHSKTNYYTKTRASLSLHDPWKFQEWYSRRDKSGKLRCLF